MRCDVVAVGTELLLGQIVDTNSAYIGEQLALVGIASHVQYKVGDNLERVVGVLREALGEADAVIVCGGLGPTHDDLTRDALAAVMGVRLERHDDIADVIRELFARRNRPMADNNLRQADVPAGASVIPQTMGTAPGLICPVRVGAATKVIYAVPGVPREMRDMVTRAVLPDLCHRQGTAATIRSHTLKTWGESESGLNERLDDVVGDLDRAGNPTLAFLASGWDGLKVRLTAKAADAAAADALLAPWVARVRAAIDQFVFGTDDQSMESVVLDMLRARGWTLGLAESLTGGLAAGRVTSVPGASDVFRGSIVSYASEVKFDVLGVPDGPVVTEAAALAMAHGARRVLGADVAMALTGVAGPTEQEGRPVGTVCIAVVTPDDTVARTIRFGGDRQQVREMSVISGLDLVRRTCTPGAPDPPLR